MDHHHLEFSLHLRDGQLLVEALLLCSEQNFGEVDVEEDVGKAFEPS